MLRIPIDDSGHTKCTNIVGVRSRWIQVEISRDNRNDAFIQKRHNKVNQKSLAGLVNVGFCVQTVLQPTVDSFGVLSIIVFANMLKSNTSNVNRNTIVNAGDN